MSVAIVQREWSVCVGHGFKAFLWVKGWFSTGQGFREAKGRICVRLPLHVHCFRVGFHVSQIFFHWEDGLNCRDQVGFNGKGRGHGLLCRLFLSVKRRFRQDGLSVGFVKAPLFELAANFSGRRDAFAWVTLRDGPIVSGREGLHQAKVVFCFDCAVEVSVLASAPASANGGTSRHGLSSYRDQFVVGLTRVYVTGVFRRGNVFVGQVYQRVGACRFTFLVRSLRVIPTFHQ